MKKNVLLSFIIVLSFSLKSIAQEHTNNKNQEKIEVLKKERKKIETEEKEQLKKAILALEKTAEEQDYSPQKLDSLKLNLAKTSTLNIQQRQAIIDNQIALLERNQTLEAPFKPVLLESDTIINTKNILAVRKKTTRERNNETHKKNTYRHSARTSGSWTLGFGFHNAIADGQSLDDSDFKIAGSRFFEIGYTFNTRIFKNSNLFYLKYGISYQSNGLKPENNRTFEENGKLTSLEVFDLELDKSKFRQDNLILPIHLQIGSTKYRIDDEGNRFFRPHKLKLGLGGYVGLNLNNTQKLKYTQGGQDIKFRQRDDFNTNNFLYGLSAYFGYENTAIYFTYGLNDVFNSQPVDLNTVQLGIRFDFE
ncbi:MAG: hypothetical protein RQ756_02945 [Flavobacteriaceae bacterium]|nr:hypothetical protein [Flavobacteriaceae bacterium]